MQLPLTFDGFKLLITIITIILLITDQITSHIQNNVFLYINNKKLRKVTIASVVVFLVVFIISLYLKVEVG